MSLARRASPSTESGARNVFINVPYDESYEPLFLAWIAGLVGLGFEPVATLMVPETPGRLQRIVNLIRSSPVSVHDLSRVESSAGSAPAHPVPHAIPTPGLASALDDLLERARVRGARLPQRLRDQATALVATAVPRFNMPFELGLAVAWRELEKDRLLGGREPRDESEQARLPQFRVFEAVEHRHRRSLSDLGGSDAYIHGGTAAGLLDQLLNAFPFERATLERLQAIHARLLDYRRGRLAGYARGKLYAASPFRRLVAAAAYGRDALDGLRRRR